MRAWIKEYRPISAKKIIDTSSLDLKINYWKLSKITLTLSFVVGVNQLMVITLMHGDIVLSCTSDVDKRQTGFAYNSRQKFAGATATTGPYFSILPTKKEMMISQVRLKLE